jgi:hypothetical protein
VPSNTGSPPSVSGRDTDSPAAAEKQPDAREHAPKDVVDWQLDQNAAREHEPVRLRR